jgi:hypothetical protein
MKPSSEDDFDVLAPDLSCVYELKLSPPEIEAGGRASQRLTELMNVELTSVKLLDTSFPKLDEIWID